MKNLILPTVVCAILTVGLFAGSGNAMSRLALTETVGGADCFEPTVQLQSPCSECTPTNNGGTFGRCQFKVEEKCELDWMGGYQWQNDCYNENVLCGGDFTIYEEGTCAMEGFYPPITCLRRYVSAFEDGTELLIDCGPI